MTHLVAIPLPVASGLLVDLIEALEVHAEALQVDTDGQVLTIAAVSSTTEGRVPGGVPARSSVPPLAQAPPKDPAPAPPVADLAERPPSSAARVDAPPGPPAPSSNGTARAVATGVVDDVLAAAVELSGFDVEQLRTSATREASTWRYAAVAVAHDRGASDLTLASRFDQATQRLRTMRARVRQNPSRYQSQIDQLVARLDGTEPAAAPSSPKQSPSELADPLSRPEALVDGELDAEGQELTTDPPPAPSFPTSLPPVRRAFDPDAARAAAGAAL